MKVFVYSKKDNHTIACVNHVVQVKEDKDKNIIVIFDINNFSHYFNTKIVKTRIYQN